MILLEKPKIEKGKEKTRLIFDLKIDDEKKSVWYEVDKEYEEYLCDDRVDAILVGILSYAMREGHDIKTDSYVTENLLFKIKEYLIPSLSKYGKSLHAIKIDANSKKAIKNIGAVGTGCSCGIDSLHAYITKSNLKEKEYNITHLCINNVGSFNSTYEEAGIENVRKKVIEKAKNFAKDVNLPLIITDSNFQEEIPQIHYFTHTYSSTFAILCLQKLWGIYYYGSTGADLSSFSIINNDIHSSGEYELLALFCFSHPNLQIYSEGMAETRLEKTQDIYQNDLVKKHLHVCLKEGYNDTTCDKCKRTLLTLYALTDDLSEYSKVFDINYFNNNKQEYFEWLYIETPYKKEMLQPIYDKLLQKDEFKKFVEEKQKENLVESTEYNYYKEECKKILESKTYKVGKMILWLPYQIKKMIKNK